ncbi:MAG: DUF1573 domain-containing protein [Patescibacteria group bacterium]
MNRNNIVIFSVVLLGLFGLMWWGRPATSSTPSPQSIEESESILSAPETLYDFGRISMADGLVNKIFRITNSGAREVELQTITTSCMCTTAYLIGPRGEAGPFGMPGHGGAAKSANELIPAGESREIKVVYDPNAHGPAGIGPVDRFIYLEEKSGGTLALEIKAVVTP